MPPRTRFSIWYYVTVFAVIVGVDSLLFSGPGVPHIAYSAFLARVEADRVARVVITQDQIYGIMKPPDATAASSAPTPAADASAPPPPLKVPGKETPWRLDPAAWWQRLLATESQYRAAFTARETQADALRARHFMVVPLPDPKLVETLQAHGVEFRGEIESHWLSNLLMNWILPFGVMFVIWGALMRRMGPGGGRGVLSIGQSKAKIYEADPSTRVTFADVAGVDEAVEETREVVAFLKDPAKYTRLGATLPKGVLLVGPPGTGKTLLARAVAGEAGVPFFNLSGSDFVEMFVGVGASRVRDLFGAAKAKAPCIIFIDELDAVGKRRDVPGVTAGGYDERENTLNQLLVEMDGFDASKGVVLVGATNRPEVLDPALRRPGRFDREILVDRPHRDGRHAILTVHARKLTLGPDVDLAVVAARTPGFVGADLANLCNEAALLASRNGRDAVTMKDFDDAFERVVGGLEKKGKVMNERERRTVAYHESGHTLVGYFTPGADPVQKVSIVPRGRGALGYTLQAPLEDRYLMSEAELLGRVRTLLGGRAAEELVFGEISTGASDDLEKASKIVRQMLTIYGMSKKLPNISLVEGAQGGFLGQGPQGTPHSAAIEQAIGEEMLQILRSAYDDAKALLSAKRQLLEALATRLLAQEKIDERDLLEVLGARP
jgi:cell division protease FtsH